MMQTKEIISNI